MENRTPITVSKAEEKDVQAIAALVIETFSEQEKITQFIIKPSKGNNHKTLIKLVEFMAKACIKSSRTILVARVQDEMVGCAIVKDSNKTCLLKKIKTYFPRALWLIIPAMKHFNCKNLLSAFRAVRLKQKLDKPYYFLEALAVHRKYQGQGVGRILLSRIDDILIKSKSNRGIYLFTGDLKNKLFYEKVGYKVIEEHTSKKLTVYHMFKERPHQ